MVDAALQDAATVTVGSDLNAVGCHCVVNELPEVRQSTNVCEGIKLLT
jgi:hypothetical protein